MAPKQIGFYNGTHKHGEPMENLIAKLKAQRAGGAAGASRDHALDPPQAGWNRQNAPQGEMPPWVAQQMGTNRNNAPPGVAAQGIHMYPAPGAHAPAPGIPPGVTPTKPVQVPPYPIRRPQSVPRPGQANLRRR
jgi:hypothetical protein